MTAPGWYNAQGDPPGTTRYWDGVQWVGDPVASPTAPAMGMGGTPGQKQLASPGARIGARLIDLIIGGIILIAFLWSAISDVIDGIDRLGPNPTDSQVQRVIEDAFSVSGTWLLAGVAAGFLWEWLWVAFAGGTPGKLIVGLRVTEAGTAQTPPNIGRAALRAANRLIPLIGAGGAAAYNASSGISGLIGLISLIMLFADSQHRTVMDRIGGTVVTKK